MIRISEVEASRGLYAVQRRNLYPFLSKEEMEGWMEDEGPLRIRWFTTLESGRRMAVAAWEVYDLHQYEEPNGPRIAILDLYTMDVEVKFRGKGVGRRLFAESLKATVESLKEAEFVAGALQIETATAKEFYEKVLASLGYSFKLETREILPGRPVYVFWVPLLGQQSAVFLKTRPESMKIRAFYYTKLNNCFTIQENCFFNSNELLFLIQKMS